MNIRTRHMVIFVYGGLAAIIILKDLLTDPLHIVGLLAPLIALGGADKIEAIARKVSGTNPK